MEELSEIFTHLKQKYQAIPYPDKSIRQDSLKKIEVLLQENAYILADAISQDFSHRAVNETLLAEITPLINTLRYCGKKLGRWMRARSRHVSWQLKPARAEIFAVPLGVVGIMVPWNYPLYLALAPAAYALAAGNRVMIKMSELSPNLGAVLATLIKQYGLEDYICMIHGDVSVSKNFSALPFAHLFFTGSTEVGKAVMATASQNLTPVTLELGGKSPAILSNSCNFDYLTRLFMGKLINAGQTCIAPDYLLIPERWQGRIEQAFSAFVDAHYPDIMDNEGYTAIISNKHQQRIMALLEDAEKKGARVVSFGQRKDGSHKLPIYLLFNVDDSMHVMQEEIFGPVLPVLTYQNFDAVIERLQTNASPLVCYYFGQSKSEIESLKFNSLTGSLVINDTLIHAAVDDLPFGGVGKSGMGHYHGQEGFDCFSKLKPLLYQSRYSSVSLLYPPHGWFTRFFLKFVPKIKDR